MADTTAKKLVLIDANSLIHRCFHALPGLMNKRGEPTGALYGVASILLKIIEREKPDYIAAAFDRPEPTFRKKLTETYKAHRPKAPDELVSQIIKARELFTAFGITFCETPGFEADDIIGTLAEKFGGKTNVIILTGDLDSLQLVRDGKVVVSTFRKGLSDTVTYNEAGVQKRFLVAPGQMVDYKALVGDISDNISGVPGIGAKGAAKLIQMYGSMDAILSSKNGSDKLTEKVKQHKTEALLSKKLAAIRLDVPLSVSLLDLLWRGLPEEKLSKLFEELDFQTLLTRAGVKRETPKKPKPDHKNPSSVRGFCLGGRSIEAPKYSGNKKTKSRL
jgi:DNA polymerase-1